MKRFLRLSGLARIAIFVVSLTSCKSDDEPSDGGSASSELVGTWYVDQTTTEYYTTVPEATDYYNHTEVEDGDGAYWEFTSSKVTVHDPNDLANNKPVSYSYNSSKKELSISCLTYRVKKLTSSTLVLYPDFSDGNFGEKVTIEFTKE